ncbi:MAG TPA: SGNH/GDSL hydrolase family protein [Actinophytocola sp.]|uniref:SGNH/GDSL hydrolase family protein n=1 Tax=Actinophytocola sp. TaxID=1872138 RepID=UPI002DBFE5EC|nr:SGNH/GDSL hydrolase family protein [Actinophytocola sp.]HEU5473599.1 SGNH/GDSL hydrolase family protein [Actinophytocola sp.]
MATYLGKFGRRFVLAAVVGSAALLATPAGSVAQGTARLPWVGTWSSAMQAPTGLFQPTWSLDGFDNQTVRAVVRISAGGPAVRVRLSNVYGVTPLRLTGATVAKAGTGASVRPGTLRPLTFHRARSVVVPAGQELVSDPVPLPAAALDRLSVSVYFAGATGPTTFHGNAQATTYRAEGDRRFAQDGSAFTETTGSFYYLTGVDVLTVPRSKAAVVAFGDSITEGALSTTDANNRYPDELAERLVAGGRSLTVLNEGISGNRVLRDSPCFGESALHRFERDVLDRPGVRTVIVSEGINDIFDIPGIPFGENCNRPNPDLTAAQLIEGHRALIRAAHARGIRIVGGTVLPFKGNTFGLFTDQGEAVRDGLNHWIRTSGEYDAVVDFAAVVSDPADSDFLRADFDSGDGVHPNDVGYRAMAAAIDLNAL